MITRSLLALLLVLTLASPCWAFPDNSVLDTFTGTDTTSPPNANWTNAELNGSSGCDLEDNALAPSATDGARHGCYWDTSTFNAAQEVYTTWVNGTATIELAVCGRLVNIGANTTDGYCVLSVDASSNIRLQRIDNEVATALGTGVTQTITNTDKIGLSMVGDQICAWFSDDGGAWAQIECVTDATYSAGGNIGVNINGQGSNGGADDFGGGSIVAAPGAALQQSPLSIVILQ